MTDKPDKSELRRQCDPSMPVSRKENLNPIEDSKSNKDCTDSSNSEIKEDPSSEKDPNQKEGKESPHCNDSLDSPALTEMYKHLSQSLENLEEINLQEYLDSSESSVSTRVNSETYKAREKEIESLEEPTQEQSSQPEEHEIIGNYDSNTLTLECERKSLGKEPLTPTFKDLMMEMYRNDNRYFRRQTEAQMVIERYFGKWFS